LAAFLASPAYWRQYNAQLAAAEAVLAGFAFAAPAAALGRRSAGAGGGVVAACGVRRAGSLGACLRDSRSRAPGLSSLARAGRAAPGWPRGVRARVPRGPCLFWCEPAWTPAAGRLPAAPPAGPLIVDSYARQLLSAMEGGARFASAGQAFQSEASQKDVRSVL